jgi:uncharacterized protein DUF6601
VHGQYGAYFARFYRLLLFIFAVFSVVLNALQIALADFGPPESTPWTHSVKNRVVFQYSQFLCGIDCTLPSLYALPFYLRESLSAL